MKAGKMMLHGAGAVLFSLTLTTGAFGRGTGTEPACCKAGNVFDIGVGYCYNGKCNYSGPTATVTCDTFTGPATSWDGSKKDFLLSGGAIDRMYNTAAGAVSHDKKVRYCFSLPLGTIAAMPRITMFHMLSTDANVLTPQTE